MYSIKICGIVQGVGFRPFIYKLAKHYDLKGYVLNSSEGVEIEVEGKQDKLELFVDSIKQQHPRAAQIERCDISIKPHRGYDAFVIRQSNINSGFTLISPDLRTCEDCSCELHNPTDFRYEYPFINCTNCGPRYSIIEKTPYDRLFTSMKDFALCSHCREEFENPFDRRFHAQPVACRQCGPKIRFLDSNLDEIIGDPISACRCEILKGKIVGIKGIGGFHMACDATNAEAVNELRKRKNRPDKPFAVMCDIDYLNNIVDYTEAQLSLLKATQAPIVLLPKAGMAMPQRSRSAARTIDNRIEVGIDSLIRSPIAESVAPQNNKLGVFLPYAPHQLLLFHSSDFHSPLYLVMTSGNANDEPIAIDENDLRGLCDYFLTHDRQILNRCDDSVILPSAIDNIIIRRSRGYVPSPVLSPVNVIPTLGTGAELKISFCLAKENQFYMSPYIGNNYSKATEDFYIETIDKYIDWFGIKPELISCDMHPDYLTTHYAENTGLPIVKVQHHHAHIAAVMAENLINEPVIGVSYDGTGYGDDGAIWGGEIFIADYAAYQRKYHLSYMPLPGGDSSVVHPIRIAYAYLTSSNLETDFLHGISSLEKRVIDSQLQNKFNLFQTSSMGRLFDCVSAMMGLFSTITFEAQSAMALEQLCAGSTLPVTTCYPFRFHDNEIDIIPLLRSVTDDIFNGESLDLIARKFHNTIIELTISAVTTIKLETEINIVVLSGGVMQNMVLLEGLVNGLRGLGISVFYASRLPANDGAIAMGQVLIANHAIKGIDSIAPHKGSHYRLNHSQE